MGIEANRIGVIDESIYNSEPHYRNGEQERGVEADVAKARREDTKREGTIAQQNRLTPIRAPVSREQTDAARGRGGRPKNKE